MKQIQKIIWLVMGAACAVNGWSQLNQNKPAIGYVYPAGAQQGKTVQILAGGQFLRGAKDVYVSGEGVSGTVVKYARQFRNLNGDQWKQLQRQLREIVDQRLSELSPQQRQAFGVKEPPETPNKEAPEKDEETSVKLPDHPLLDNLENQSLRELAHRVYALRFPRNKLQQNRQLSELVVIELTVAPDAKPGRRELRLDTRGGLTNPITFQVGMLPETCELEPNEQLDGYVFNALFPSLKKAAVEDFLRAEPLELPVVVNGQIMPGDADRFRFRAKTGQHIVIDVQARSLIPYLADAVPGWFQATATLYNAAGKELAFTDDYRFNPDPVMFYDVPRDGIYELEIRDSIYRGREDFVYRVSVGELPFITRMFPLGGRQDTETVASIDGINLKTNKLTLDTASGAGGIRSARINDTKAVSNAVPYAVDTLQEQTEAEANDSIEKAEKVALGTIVNGRIGSAGDVDVFAFQGKAGEQISGQVYARCLNSPLDSILRLTDSFGNVLAWNDDYVLKDSYLYKDSVGLVTHHADSYLVAELPKDGTYYMHLADSQHHGSAAHAYRLHLTAAQPDFQLRVTPSSLSFRPGAIQPVTLHVLRQDGFDGEINIALKDAPEGFQLIGGRIPAGCDRIAMTVTAPAKPKGIPLRLTLEGSATVGDKTIRHPVIPADDVMQAFLYRHLVPAQDLLATITNVNSTAPPFEVATNEPVRITSGTTAKVMLKTPRKWLLNQLRLELYQPPEGISLGDLNVQKDGVAISLKAAVEGPPAGFEDNLIIEAYREFIPKDKDGNPTGPQRRNWVGVIPALPIQIVPEEKKEVLQKETLQSRL